MATSIFNAGSTLVPANPNIDPPRAAYLSIKYIVTTDNITFYYGTVNDPVVSDDPQTYLNANASYLLADAQSKNQVLPTSLISCLTTGQTQVATLPGTTVNPYIPQKIQVLLAQAFHVTTGPTFGIGTSAGVNDLMPLTSFAGWTAQNRLLNFDLANVVGTGVAYGAITPVFLNVTVAAVVTASGLFGVTVQVIGASALNF